MIPNPYWIAAKAVFGGVWRFLKSIPWQVWAFALVVVLALLYGENRADARETLVREEYAARDAAAADALAKVNAKNRQVEVRMAERLAAIAAKHEEDKARAIQETRDTVLADLRAGRLQLRIPQRGNSARSGQAASPASLGDGEAAVRGEDALNLAVADSIALAAEADAHVTACQAVIHTYLQGPQ